MILIREAHGHDKSAWTPSTRRRPQADLGGTIGTASLRSCSAAVTGPVETPTAPPASMPPLTAIAIYTLAHVSQVDVRYREPLPHFPPIDH